MLPALACLVIMAISAPLFQHQLTKSPFSNLLCPLLPPPSSRLLQYSGARTSNCSKMSLLCQAGSEPDQSSLCNNRNLLADDRLRQSPGRLSGLFSLASPPLLLVDSRGGLAWVSGGGLCVPWLAGWHTVWIRTLEKQTTMIKTKKKTPKAGMGDRVH